MGPGQRFPQTVISHFSKNYRLDFSDVGPAVRKAFLRNIGFLDSADDKLVAAHIQDLHNFALKMDRVLLDERGSLQQAIKDLEFTGCHFISFRA